MDGLKQIQKKQVLELYFKMLLDRGCGIVEFIGKPLSHFDYGQVVREIIVLTFEESIAINRESAVVSAIYSELICNLNYIREGLGDYFKGFATHHLLRNGIDINQ